jgi:arylsulfatase A-like enzyme
MSHIYQREAQFNEEWMVVLTTDHGGNGTGHGGQDNIAETRYVWYVIRSPSFTKILIPQGKTVDLLPTMMKWIGVSSSNLGLDGTSLY